LPSIIDQKDQWIVAGVAFTLTLLTLDLIPNGMWACYPYLIAGALTRRVHELKAEARERELVPESA
jgi:hypothetical protein